jgi:DNA-binding MarR family transcriptional regulator
MMITRSEIIEIVSKDILSIPPLVFRAVRNKITKNIISDFDLDITPHHFEIIRLLADNGTMHSSKIGEKLQIGKAQMTQLINRMVSLDIIERTMDESDRRTYNIKLKPEAIKLLNEHKQYTFIAVEEIMSSLSDQELENLSISLRKLRDILITSANDISTK